MYSPTTAHRKVPIYPESDGKPKAETDVHRNLLADLVFSLENYFQPQPDVYVSGNLLVYYVEGNPAKCFAPDVFVVRGVPKGQRRIYKLWEEGVVPQIVIELTSRKTWKEDLQTKWELYRELGVQEYFIFDPKYDYLDEALVGYRLENGKYADLEIKDRRVKSEVLKLELIDTGETLRPFDPTTDQFLPNARESAAAYQRLEESLQHTAELESTLARYREQFGELPK
jgi:Uma2 family endonuclease